MLQFCVRRAFCACFARFHSWTSAAASIAAFCAWPCRFGAIVDLASQAGLPAGLLGRLQRHPAIEGGAKRNA